MLTGFIKTMQTFVQKLDSALRPKGAVFYGWWIVGSANGVQWLGSMLWIQSYGAYMVLLLEEFGWSKALVAGAFALTRIESGILGPLQGWLVDRFGPRLILSIGMILFGLGFFLFSQVQSLLGFYLSFVVIALGSSLGGWATLMVAIVSWFNRHRSKAIAASQIGFSLGGLSVPVIVVCLEQFGWRTTAIISGFVVLVVGLPLAQTVRHRPEEWGEVPDGVSLDTAERDNRELPSRDFTARQAMRTRAFWLISAGHAFALLVVSSMLVHLIPHLTEGLGYSLSEASLVVALLTVFQMIGIVAGGYLGDKVNKRLICVICMFAHAGGLLLVTYASVFFFVFSFVFLHGLAWGARGPLMVSLRADYFGATSFGTIMGVSSLIVMIGMSAGPIVAGYLADLTGDYKVGFTLLALLSLLGSVCFFLATPPEGPGGVAEPS